MDAKHLQGFKGKLGKCLAETSSNVQSVRAHHCSGRGFRGSLPLFQSLGH